MGLAIGRSVGVEVCEILGIDPTSVQNITISIGANELVKVRVRRLVTDNEIKQVLHLVERYELKPVE